ncbi:MAG: chitobiase/beta-hexosaminidase C-terminal domain-containing protein [Lachnospiraceae bacterium]|nr:chitobiase/beta-hexosaminidase C-terminal domain-containing protein [Lachnospiraceae bacterium]
MICPKCGKEIEEGKLYCDTCGEEIKIVPDFDPEIENSITKILNDVADEAVEWHTLKKVSQGAYVTEESKEEEDEKLRKEFLRKNLRIVGVMGGIFVLLIVVFSLIYFFLDYRYTNYEYQMRKASEYVSGGQLTEAAETYRHVIDLRGHDSLATYHLANVNLALDDKESALLLYKEVVADDEAESDLRYNACKNVIDIYVSDENYQAISDFLTTVGDNEITDYFQNYKCSEPEFSYNEGTYEEVIPLKLMSSSGGNIYYTTDGSVPTTGNEIYSSPIFLENGVHVVSAFTLNSYGVQSRVVTKEFRIEGTTPSAPEVLTYSGDYDAPTLIEVDVYEGARVFYTTDKTDPTMDSIEYKTPIHMPLGKSEYRFITYNESGEASEVTTRNYNLSIKTNVSVEAAQKSIVDGMIEINKIYSEDGRSMEIFGRYLYVYQYVTTIEGAGDFYIIAEIMEDTEGNRTRTGTLFAVGLYNGKRYKLGLDDKNNYVFFEF